MEKLEWHCRLEASRRPNYTARREQTSKKASFSVS